MKNTSWAWIISGGKPYVYIYRNINKYYLQGRRRRKRIEEEATPCLIGYEPRWGGRRKKEKKRERESEAYLSKVAVSLDWSVSVERERVGRTHRRTTAHLPSSNNRLRSSPRWNETDGNLFQPSRQTQDKNTRARWAGTAHSKKTQSRDAGGPPSFSAGQRPAIVSPFFFTRAATVKKIFLCEFEINGLFINQKPSQNNNGAQQTLSANNKCQYAKYRGKAGISIGWGGSAKVKITTHKKTRREYRRANFWMCPNLVAVEKHTRKWGRGGIERREKDSASRSDHGRQLSSRLVPQAANTASRGSLTQHGERERASLPSRGGLIPSLLFLFFFPLSSLLSFSPFAFWICPLRVVPAHTDQKDTPPIFFSSPTVHGSIDFTSSRRRSYQPNYKPSV